MSRPGRERGHGECARSIIAEYQRFDAEYGRTTRHGMTDGARFP
jgi:hypothetical protein